jgi:hypothetical protein
MWFAWCGVAQCVDVRGRRCVGRSTSGSCGNRIADLACGCVRRPGKGAQLPCPLAPAREGSGALDRLARAGVSGSLGLEQRQHPLGAIGSPEGDTSAVFVAQGQLVHPHILPVLALPVAANHTSDGAGSPRCVHSGAAAVQGPLTPQAVGARRPRSVAGWGRAFGACCFAGKLPSPGGPGPVPPSSRRMTPTLIPTPATRVPLAGRERCFRW